MQDGGGRVHSSFAFSSLLLLLFLTPASDAAAESSVSDPPRSQRPPVVPPRPGRPEPPDSFSKPVSCFRVGAEPPGSSLETMFWQDEAVTIEMENLAALSARPPEGGKAPNTQDVGGALRPVASKHSKPIVSCF